MKIIRKCKIICGNLARLEIDRKLEKYEKTSISLSLYIRQRLFFYHGKSNIHDFMEFLEKPKIERAEFKVRIKSVTTAVYVSQGFI